MSNILSGQAAGNIWVTSWNARFTFQQTVEMTAVDLDFVESALRDVNLSSGREIILKPEQESAVRALIL